MSVLDSPPGPRKRGGQVKINPARLAAFVSYVANGMPLKTAAKGIGVSESTRQNWSRRGMLELTRLRDAGTDPSLLIDPTAQGWPSTDDWTNPPAAFDPDEWPFVVFAVATEKAMASFEARALTTISTASQTSWQAAAWLLERRNPDEYSRPEARLRIAHEGANGGPVQVEQTVISVEDLEAKFRALDEQIGKETA